MAIGTENTKETTPKTAANKAAAPVVLPEKRTITLTFEGADLELHDRIVKQASDEDRSASTELLRSVRKYFPKPMATDNA